MLQNKVIFMIMLINIVIHFTAELIKLSRKIDMANKKNFMPIFILPSVQ